MKKPLYVVHTIDTEGPLYESLDETFLRLKRAYGVELVASKENLQLLQEGNCEFLDEDTSNAISTSFSKKLLCYNDTWDKIDSMLEEMLSPEYRGKYPDKSGSGWLFSWFLLDHVGFDINPRRRDIGYHNIFDHYLAKLKETGSLKDGVEWHFHPMSTYKEAHTCATSFLNSPHLLQVLARRIIDRSWFPTCFRAGFHTERPDSHWFLEQWIPFDFSNQALKLTTLDSLQQDLSDGRFGDWRRAPDDWSHYHPSPDDYQTRGLCKRTIFRCLNVGTRLRLLDQVEVDKAFARADEGLPTVLAFTNHDFRDMREDVDYVYSMLLDAEKRYPEVDWCHSDAKSAAQAVLSHEVLDIEVNVELESCDGTSKLVVVSSLDSFSPQPFLAIKTSDRKYISDNFDCHSPRREWSYTFDDQSTPISCISEVGVAITFYNGECHIVNIDVSSGEKRVTVIR